MSTISHNIDLKTCGTRHQSISVFISHFIHPPLKAATPCQKLPFHVVAVDRQTSGSKMLINLTGSAAMLCALIWNSDWWVGARLGSQGKSDSYQFIPLFEGSCTPRLISHCHSLSRLHMTFHFLLLVMGSYESVCNRSCNKVKNSVDQRTNQTAAPVHVISVRGSRVWTDFDQIHYRQHRGPGNGLCAYYQLFLPDTEMTLNFGFLTEHSLIPTLTHEFCSGDSSLLYFIQSGIFFNICVKSLSPTPRQLCCEWFGEFQV